MLFSTVFDFGISNRRTLQLHMCQTCQGQRLKLIDDAHMYTYFQEGRS